MKRLTVFLLVIALSLTNALAAGPQAVPAAGSLQDQLRKGLPDGPSNTSGHVVHYVLEAVEGVEVGLAVASVHSASLALLGIEVAGPIAGMAAVYVALGNAHADAINSVIKDQIHSGFSRGVVLGADRRPESFVKYQLRQALARAPHRVSGVRRQVSECLQSRPGGRLCPGEEAHQTGIGRVLFGSLLADERASVSHVWGGLEAVERAILDRLLHRMRRALPAGPSQVSFRQKGRGSPRPFLQTHGPHGSATDLSKNDEWRTPLPTSTWHVW